jgi:hypothetical protein
MEIVFLVWLALCGAVFILANRYNRSGPGWFIISLLFSPLVGAAFVLALGPLSSNPVEPVHAGYQPRTGDRAPDNPPNQGSAGRVTERPITNPYWAAAHRW